MQHAKGCPSSDCFAGCLNELHLSRRSCTGSASIHTRSPCRRLSGQIRSPPFAPRIWALSNRKVFRPLLAGWPSQHGTQEDTTPLFHHRKGGSGFLSCWFVSENLPQALKQAKRGSIQRSHPDIAKTDGQRRVAVCLQFDCRFGVRDVFRLADIEGLAGQLGVVLYQHAVVEQRDVGW